MPPHIIENWKLLRQKATQTVLDRGILIPHPKEDYDLLEERLLESLELKTPRILKCGHFHLSPEEEADVAGSDTLDSDEDEDADADICDDCGRRIRDGRFGSGVGSKRWDIKLFAANGLMRAGAWGAAWREMERVDVEIVPWMDEDMKRQLELQRLDELESTTASQPHAIAVDEGLEDAVPQPHPVMDEARMREIYGDSSAQPYTVDDFDRDDERINSNPLPGPQSHIRGHEENQRVQQQQSEQHREIPLPVVLRNYIYLLISAQDGRNLAIGVLSLLVLVLTLRNFTTPQPPPPVWTYNDAFRHQQIISVRDVPNAHHLETTSVYATPVSTASVISVSDHIPTSAPLVGASNAMDPVLNPDHNQKLKLESEAQPIRNTVQHGAGDGNEEDGKDVRDGGEGGVGEKIAENDHIHGSGGEVH